MKVVVLDTSKLTWSMVEATHIEFYAPVGLWRNHSLFLGTSNNGGTLHYWREEILCYPDMFDMPPLKGCGGARDISPSFREFTKYNCSIPINIGETITRL